MKKQLLFIVMVLLPLVSWSQCFQNPSEYVYGCYGLQSYPKKSDYQKYVGKVFTYLPASPRLLAAEEEIDIDGDPGDQFIITMVNTDDEDSEQMDVILYLRNLTRKQSRSRKRELYNYDNTPSIWQSPLINMDDVNEELKDAIGKKFSREDVENTYEIVDAKFENLYEDSPHPSVVYYVKDSCSGMIFRAENMNGRSTELGDLLFKRGNKLSLIRVERPKNTFERYGEFKSVELEGRLVNQYSDSLVIINILPYTETKYTYPYDLVLGAKSFLNDEDLKNNRESLEKLYLRTKEKYERSIISPNCFMFRVKNKSDNTIKIIWDEAVYVGIDGTTSPVLHTGQKFSKKETSQVPSTIIRGASLSDILIPTDLINYDKRWIADPLYNNEVLVREPLTFRIMIPIQIQDVVNEYIFEFEVKEGYTLPFTIEKK